MPCRDTCPKSGAKIVQYFELTSIRPIKSAPPHTFPAFSATLRRRGRGRNNFTSILKVHIPRLYNAYPTVRTVRQGPSPKRRCTGRAGILPFDTYILLTFVSVTPKVPHADDNTSSLLSTDSQPFTFPARILISLRPPPQPMPHLPKRSPQHL